jgi:hypothetical protein
VSILGGRERDEGYSCRKKSFSGPVRVSSDEGRLWGGSVTMYV